MFEGVSGCRVAPQADVFALKDVNGLADVMNLRGHVYSLARNLTCSYPSVELLTNIRKSQPVFSLMEDFESIHKICAGAVQCLSDEHSYAEVQNEYTRLFVGPASLPAPLWESVFLDKEHILFGEDTLAVRKFYAMCNFEFHERATRPDDHISIELELLYRLNESALQIVTARDNQVNLKNILSICELQLQFLRCHLLRWAPEAFALQLPHASTLVYQGLAELLVSFLPYDAHILIALQGDVARWI
ncbi:MAG: molecular chaperone TorD family protein [Desulfovibrio sp.]|jgi:TorA maturation chaperone TorD|nr:molecular chaperone TorD family protein [Desulfovibrio sp.]